MRSMEAPYITRKIKIPGVIAIVTHKSLYFFPLS